MSIAELKAEIAKLSPAEKIELRDALETAVAETEKPPAKATQLGCMEGTAILKPGWDQDEPLEDWEVLRDDPSS
jgi:hypothetical protein